MEILDQDIMSLLADLEADVDTDDLDFDPEADEPEEGWGLFGWEGPDED